MSAAEPPQGANSRPRGGSAAAKPQAWGDHTSAAEPPQGANSAPAGGSAAAKPQAWGDHTSAAEPPQGANSAPAGGSAAAQPQAWGDHASALVRATLWPSSAGEIAARLALASVIGNPDRPVHAIGSLSAIGAGLLTFCDATALAEPLAETRASVVIVAAGAAASPRADQTLIAVADVRAAFIDCVEFLSPGVHALRIQRRGVHPSAVVDDNATLSRSAAIGAGARIGARTRIGPGAVIYADSVIGRDCVVGPGAIIGWVGLAYHDRADGARRSSRTWVVAGSPDRVDVGAQTCVCRGMPVAYGDRRRRLNSAASCTSVTA